MDLANDVYEYEAGKVRSLVSRGLQASGKNRENLLNQADQISYRLADYLRKTYRNRFRWFGDYPRYNRTWNRSPISLTSMGDLTTMTYGQRGNWDTLSKLHDVKPYDVVVSPPIIYFVGERNVYYNTSGIPPPEFFNFLEEMGLTQRAAEHLYRWDFGTDEKFWPESAEAMGKLA